jgi:hypothetical protein
MAIMKRREMVVVMTYRLRPWIEILADFQHLGKCCFTLVIMIFAHWAGPIRAMGSVKSEGVSNFPG